MVRAVSRRKSELDEILVQSIVLGSLEVARQALQMGARRLEDALLTAVCHANNAAVDLLLDFPIHVNALSPTTGLSALHHCVIQGDTATLKLLLSKGKANPNVHSKGLSSYTPLQCCLLAPRPNYTVLRLLLESGANAKVGLNGISLLFILPDEFAAAAVPLLLQYGADITTPQGFTALHTASATGQIQKMQALLQAENSIDLLHHLDNQGDTALHWAAAEGQLHAIRWLLDQDSRLIDRVNKEGQTCLDVACAKKQADAALYLLPRISPVPQDSSTVEYSVYTPLHWLCEADKERSPYTYEDKGLCNLAQALVEKQKHDCAHKTTTCIIHASTPLGEQALHLAARWSAPLCQWLLEQGANPLAGDVRMKRGTLLMAASEGTVETVSCLLDKVARAKHHELLNQQDENGWTALHYAACRQHPKMLKILLQHGASVEIRNQHGRQPLHLVGANTNFPLACSGMHDDVISHILDHSCDLPNLHVPDSISRECIRVLVHSGASATAVDQRGDLPFFLVACTEKIECCFEMVRVAAGQGMFDGNSTQRSMERKLTKHLA